MAQSTCVCLYAVRACVDHRKLIIILYINIWVSRYTSHRSDTLISLQIDQVIEDLAERNGHGYVDKTMIYFYMFLGRTRQTMIKIYESLLKM